MRDLGSEIYELIFKRNRLVRFAAVTLLVYLFFRCIFAPAAPFLLAFLLITLFYPFLQRIQKKIPVKKKFLAAGVVFFTLLLLAALIWAVLGNGSIELEDIVGFVEKSYDKLKLTLHNCCCSLDGKFGWNGYEIESFVVEKMTVIMENVKVQIAPKLLSSSYSCFKAIISSAAFILITVLAAVLMEKDYSRLMEWLKNSGDMAFIWKTLEGVLNYIITFIKAQGVILLIISVLCIFVLWAAGIDGNVFLGILAGCLDVLPFIGTGIVLVPTAVWQLLGGHYIAAIVCLLLYIVCICVREFLEPKLVGEKLGIAPVLMLIGIYAGVRLFGTGGIIEGPLAVIVIYEMMKQGDEEAESEADE